MGETSPSSTGGASSIPGPGAKSPRASRPKKQNGKQKQHCNKFNKDFKNGPHQKKKKKIKKKYNHMLLKKANSETKTIRGKC